MSHLKSEQSGKSLTTSSPTIAFRFRSGDEELEELHVEDHDSDISEKSKNLDSDSNSLKVDDDKGGESTNETTPVKEYWNLLGKRSTSVDSGCESPFPHSNDPWRKFNELKGKLTKTVEEKISEMKIERNKSNVLGISSRARLVNSKENSSISDSEDTSESSRLSESLKDSEEASPKKKLHNRSDTIASIIDSVLENVKSEAAETEPDEGDFTRKRLSDLIKVSEIKISTAKSELKEPPSGEVESGVEADENFISDRPGDSNNNPSDVMDPYDNDSERNSEQSVVQDWPPPSRNTKFSNFACILLAKKAEFIVLIAAIIIYYIFPMSSFLKGLFTGVILMLIGDYVYNYVMNFTFEMKNNYIPSGPFKIPIYEMLAPLKVPKQSSSKGVWFNEYTKEYDPDLYSVTQTVPVYLEVNDCYLKLSRPKGKINKRATYDEPEYKLNFLNHRLYNISNCSVLLLPEGLTKKRLYSKKYPIVIMLRQDSLITEKIKDKDGSNEMIDEEDTDPDNTETDDTVSQSYESVYGKMYLNLFARCDRQKEEWYRKLLAATKAKITPEKPEKQTWAVNLENNEETSPDESTSNDPPVTPFESIFYDEEEAQYEEYLRYMTQFVDVENEAPKIEFFPSLKTLKTLKTSFFKRLWRRKKAALTLSAPVRNELPENNSNIKPNNRSPGKINVSRSWPTKGKTATNEEEDVNRDIPPQSPLQTRWFNAFVNRILFDVFRSPFWLEQIRMKMERKLNSIRMPFYVENMEIVELDLGKMGPRFHRVSSPVIDDLGLWFDMDLTFDGLVKVTIQTQLNLIKLQKGIEQSEEEEPVPVQEKPKEMKPVNKPGKKEKKKNVSIKTESKIFWEADEAFSNIPIPFTRKSRLFKVGGLPDIPENPEMPSEQENAIAELVDIAFDQESVPASRSPMYDSELEDSAESSDEDEDDDDDVSTSSTVEPVPETVPVSQKKHVPIRRSSKKLFRIFENVAQSKYFKSVAQSKYVQKAIAGVSQTKLKLSLEIKGCVGTVAVNIPPPPSDRLWYGFREMPKVWLSAHPKIGEKHVRISHVKNFLEKKIMQEFKKVMVLPNMDDVILPTYPQVFNPAPVQTAHPIVPDVVTTPPSDEISQP